MQFADILRVDPSAILGAFLLRKPPIAHDFAINKFMLVQMNPVDELTTEERAAIAAVDPLTALEAHLQLFEQLSECGSRQLSAGGVKRGEGP